MTTQGMREIATLDRIRAKRKHLGKTVGYNLTEAGEVKLNMMHTGQETINIKHKKHKLRRRLAKYGEQRDETETRLGRHRTRVTERKE